MHSRSEYRQHAVFCILSSSSLNERVNCPCHGSPALFPHLTLPCKLSSHPNWKQFWTAGKHSPGGSSACLMQLLPTWRQSRQVVAQPPRSSTLAISGVGTERAQQGAGPTSLHLVSCLQGNVQMMTHERLMTEGEAIKKVKLEEGCKHQNITSDRSWT